MRITARWVVVAAASAAMVLGGSKVLEAAAPPAVAAVAVIRDDVNGRHLVSLSGTLLTKINGFTLFDAGAMPVSGTVDTLERSKTHLLLGLPPGIKGQEFDLTPLFKGGSLPALHLRIEDGVLFRGTFGSGTIPFNGIGERMMWYPGKAAFRAGCAFGSSWNDQNVGEYSFAGGRDTTASNANTFAMGDFTSATGSGSSALGGFTTSSGTYSTSLGGSTLASGDQSLASGFSTIASGVDSTCLGQFTTAQAFGSLVLGRFNAVGGNSSTWVDTDPVLVVGNGANGSAPSNAFTLLKNGNLTISGTLTQASDARLKTDVTPLARVLARLAGVHAVSYRMKDTGRGPAGAQIGLLAQEVRAAFPELVQEDSAGTLSVAYGNFSAVLLAALQEQQAALEARDAEVAALRKELAGERASTEKRLARLEALLAKSTGDAGEPAPAVRPR